LCGNYYQVPPDDVRNLNHIITFNEAEVANAFKKEFSEIKNGGFPNLIKDYFGIPKKINM